MPGAALSTGQAPTQLVLRSRQQRPHAQTPFRLPLPSLWGQDDATPRTHTPFLDQALAAWGRSLTCLSGPSLLLGLAWASSLVHLPKAGLLASGGRACRGLRTCRLGCGHPAQSSSQCEWGPSRKGDVGCVRLYSAEVL